MPYTVPKARAEIKVDALGATWSFAPPNEDFMDNQAMRKPSRSANVLFDDLLLGWSGVEANGTALEFTDAAAEGVPLQDRMEVLGAYLVEIGLVSAEGEGGG